MVFKREEMKKGENHRSEDRRNKDGLFEDVKVTKSKD